MKYIILRSPSQSAREVEKSSIEPSPRRSGLLGTTSRSATDARVGPVGVPSRRSNEHEVEITDLSPGDVVDIRRDTSLAGLALPMPMRLLKPLKATQSGSTRAPKISWGLKEIGATRCDLTGDGITVAVLDTGIDKKHPAFAGVNVVTKNFTNESGEDLDGHGTHCAGIVFGQSVGDCRIGVAPGIKKALIGKVIGKSGVCSDVLVEALQWAFKNGAQVISMSLGFDYPGYQKELVDAGFPAEVATSRALEEYLANVRLFDRLCQFLSPQDHTLTGTVIVAAAGNESERDKDKKFRINASPPAVSQNVVSVAAVGQTGDKSQPLAIASFSNGGARVCAPGVDIWSAEPGEGLVAMSGTSMAAPHVAGVAALWAEQLQRESGVFRASAVIAKIEGLARRTKGLEAADVAAGLVQAPQFSAARGRRGG
jgi:subtilisin family serine protease